MKKWPELSAQVAELMTAILNAIDESMTAGKPVYVHCWGGAGRTGTVIGRCLKSSSWFDEAISSAAQMVLRWRQDTRSQMAPRMA